MANVAEEVQAANDALRVSRQLEATNRVRAQQLDADRIKMDEEMETLRQARDALVVERAE